MPIKPDAMHSGQISHVAGKSNWGYNIEMVAMAQTGAIERMLQAQGRDLSPEVARLILLWDFDDADQSRVAELSAKARAGSLSADENDELDWYLLLGDFLSIVQSKARLALRKSSSAA